MSLGSTSPARTGERVRFAGDPCKKTVEGSLRDEVAADVHLVPGAAPGNVRADLQWTGGIHFISTGIHTPGICEQCVQVKVVVALVADIAIVLDEQPCR